MPGLREYRSMTDPVIHTQRSLSELRAVKLRSSLVSSLLCPPLERFPLWCVPSPLVLLYRTQTCTHIYQPSLPSSPSYTLPFLVPRANPDDQADRAGDTLSGKTGRRTKEGAPKRCVAIYSVFVLRLPSAPRTNPTSRASRRAALGDCRSAAASMFSL